MERKHWSKEEDLALNELVEELGSSNWTIISVRLMQKHPQYSRTGKQCRQRWSNYLSKSMSKIDWSTSEEQLLFSLHKNYGNKWKQISKNMKNRTESEIKNHLYASLRKGVRRINKLLNLKVDAKVLREIKPSTLTEVCLEDDYVELFDEKTSISEVMKQISTTSAENTMVYFDCLQYKETLHSIFNKILEKNKNLNELYNKKSLQKNHKKQNHSAELTKYSEATALFEKQQKPIEEEESIDIMKWLDLGEKISVQESVIVQDPIEIDNFLVFGKDCIEQSVFFDI